MLLRIHLSAWSLKNVAGYLADLSTKTPFNPVYTRAGLKLAVSDSRDTVDPRLRLHHSIKQGSSDFTCEFPLLVFREGAYINTGYSFPQVVVKDGYTTLCQELPAGCRSFGTGPQFSHSLE